MMNRLRYDTKNIIEIKIQLNPKPIAVAIIHDFKGSKQC